MRSASCDVSDCEHRFCAGLFLLLQQSERGSNLLIQYPQNRRRINHQHQNLSLSQRFQTDKRAGRNCGALTYNFRDQQFALGVNNPDRIFKADLAGN